MSDVSTRNAEQHLSGRKIGWKGVCSTGAAAVCQCVQLLYQNDVSMVKVRG